MKFVKFRLDKSDRLIRSAFRVQKAGFALVQVQLGPVPTPQVVPVVDGEPKTLGDLEEAAEAGKFDPKQLKAITAKLAELTTELGDVIRAAAKIDGEMHTDLAAHEQQAVRPVIAARFAIPSRAPTRRCRLRCGITR